MLIYIARYIYIFVENKENFQYLKKMFNVKLRWQIERINDSSFTFCSNLRYLLILKR